MSRQHLQKTILMTISRSILQRASGGVLALLALLLAISCAAPEQDEDHDKELSSTAQVSNEISEFAIQQRSHLANSRLYLVKPTMDDHSFGPIEQALINALDIPAAMNPAVISFERPDATAAAALTAMGTILPTKGTHLLMLSTGRSTTAQTAEPGADFTPAGAAGDVVRLKLTVNVPTYSNRISFDLNFMSAEAPEYVGSAFNDTFRVWVTDADPRREIASTSINGANFHLISDTTLGLGTPFSLYVDDATGVNKLFGNGTKVDAGTTGFASIHAPIRSNGIVTIEFEIFDVGDGLLDTAALIDNMIFSSVEKIDPNTGDPNTDLIDNLSGRVYVGVDKIAAGGNPVTAVAADGVTQILLRSKVPGPGYVDFTIPIPSAPAQPLSNGLLSLNKPALAWGYAARATATFYNGAYYAFALYQSPPDFAREPGEYALLERPVTISMKFVPDVNPGTGSFNQDFTLDIRRPPVLILPDMWTSCDMGWNMLRGDPRFFTKCAIYEETISEGFHAESNSDAVQNSIAQTLSLQRGHQVAATQVDVLGHGVGGILARRFVDSVEYQTPESFGEGTVNRIVTVNTPNLGSRMAREIVRFREHARETQDHFGNLIETFNHQGIKLDCVHKINDPLNDADDTYSGNCMIDQLQPSSPWVKNIAANEKVPHHALYSTGGRDVSVELTHQDPDGIIVFAPKLQPLYSLMEQIHPSTEPQSETVQQTLIHGSQSVIFCDDSVATEVDNHDMFLTSMEQTGGLSATRVTQFMTRYPDPDAADPEFEFYQTEHFYVPERPLHEQRLIELLNNSVSSDSFTSASSPMPAPVPPENHCLLPDELPLSEPFAPPQLHALPTLLPGNIAISSPAAGTIVPPGSNVTVTVQTTGNAPSRGVAIVGPSGIRIIRNPPFTAIVKIPSKSIGTVNLHAFAFYGPSLQFTTPVPVQVRMPPTITLSSVQILNGDVILARPGKTQQLKVLGVYSDGVRRDITSDSTETVYDISSTKPVITISADGLITALKQGYATVVAYNSGVLTSINVRVGAPRCGDNVQDPGEACDDGNLVPGDGCSPSCTLENRAPIAVCQSPTACNDQGACSANITLGRGSFDPDGDDIAITQSPAGPYAVGHHAVSVNVSDGTNSAQCVAQLEVQDCEPPSLACAANLTAECTGGGGAVITPPAAAGSDNCAVAVNVPASGQRPLGISTLTYTASDPSGNNASCSTQVTVLDTIPPAVTCPPPAVAECTGAGQAAVNPGTGSASDSCTTASVSSPGTGTYPLGTTGVTYTATDLSGNQNTCQTTVTVRDTTAPSVMCPAPKVAECVANGHATVDPGHATATDSCTIVAVSDPGPGSYGLGTTPVVFTATDSSGNQASCDTSVTVNDTTAPGLACPAPMVAECTSNSQAVVDPVPAAGSDACSGSLDSDLGPSSYPLGTTPVTYTAQDPAGNQTSCATSVTVQDTLAPSITCPSLTVAECTGNNQATVNPGSAVVSDACSAVSVVNPSSGPYPLGDTQVAFTAMDTSSNQSSCNSTIKVVDTLPPQLSLTPPAPLWPPNHQYHTITLADCHPVVQDSCGGVLTPGTYQAAVTCVTSDEPDNTAGPHDGNTINDIVIVDDSTVKIRAERHSSFDGRVYKIHFKVHDGSGNITNGICPIIVPYYECKPDDKAECSVGDSGVAQSVCH
jgi:cysteine-rich repeat protein